jgi:hypothetical protein
MIEYNDSNTIEAVYLFHHLYPSLRGNQSRLIKWPSNASGEVATKQDSFAVRRRIFVHNSTNLTQTNFCFQSESWT